MLTAAGKSEHVPVVLQNLGEAVDAADVRDCVKLAETLCGGKLPARAAVVQRTTFEQVAVQWTSGDLHRQWPDHVRAKRTAEDDISRLEKLYPVIGNVPIIAFKLEDADRAMASIPPNGRPVRVVTTRSSSQRCSGSRSIRSGSSTRLPGPAAGCQSKNVKGHGARVPRRGREALGVRHRAARSSRAS